MLTYSKSTNIMANAKVYPSGLFINEKREGSPDFVLGGISISVDSFSKWLSENKQLVNEKGYLRLDMLIGKEDKPYAVVNTYGLDSAPAQAETKPLHVDGDLPF